MDVHTMNGHAEKQKDWTNFYRYLGIAFVGNPDCDGERRATCPQCSCDDKFFINIYKSTYHCFHENSCGLHGNNYDMMRAVHAAALAATTNPCRHEICRARGLSVQTLQRHGLAKYEDHWLIPSHNKEGKVVSLIRYWPKIKGENKKIVPGCHHEVFNLQNLSKDPLPLFVCEGAFDAIALDQRLGQQHLRQRYDVIASPNAGIWKENWSKLFEGREVRLCFDNDDAGRKAQDKIAIITKEMGIRCDLKLLRWPEGYAKGYDISDLVRDLGDNCHPVEFTRVNSTPYVPSENSFESGLILGRDIPADPEYLWLDQFHLPFSEFVSISGRRGCHKSDYVRDIAARATAGLSMPGGGNRHDPMHVIYVTTEDSGPIVRELIHLAGGNLDNLSIYDLCDKEKSIDILLTLDEIADSINRRRARLLIVDNLNDCTASAKIKTDAEARSTLSHKLLYLPRKTGICFMGIRNAGRTHKEDQSKTTVDDSLGATSIADVSRSAVTISKLVVENGCDPRFRATFERITNCIEPKPMEFFMEDLHTCDEDTYKRRIKWIDMDKEKKELEAKKAKFAEELERARQDVERKTCN